MSRPIWVELPVDTDAGECAPTLYDNDCYLVRLRDESVVWSVFCGDNGEMCFLPSDGEEVLSNDGLDNVVAVMTAGYGPGVAERVIAESAPKHAAYMSDVRKIYSGLKAAFERKSA